MTDFNDDNQNALVPQDNDEPMSMTLSGVGRGDSLEDVYEGEAASGGGGLLSNTTLLIVAVAIVAAGSLFIMRATQGELTSSDEVQEIETKIANAINRLNNPTLLPEGDPLLTENLSMLLAPTDEITAIFNRDVRDQQVPIEQVKKNPFSLSLAENGLNGGTPDKGNADRALAQLLTEARSLQLQSIMLGARNIAVIGGEFYKQGDKVGSFTVTEIDKFTVYMHCDGQPFELSLKDQVN
jgi:hypothetical protein